jgi:hypothetical protein
VTWVNPTARTDGSAFNPATDQASVTVNYGTTKGGPYTGTATSPGAATSIVIQLPLTPTCGTFYFVGTVTDTGGLVSDPSAETAKVYACRPGAPTALTVK